jgi:hypothetical protein
MKIIFVTSGQFQKIWNHLLPSQRDGGSVPSPVIILRHLDTMLVLKSDVTIGSIEAFPEEEISLRWLNETISQNNFFEVG